MVLNLSQDQNDFIKGHSISVRNAFHFVQNCSNMHNMFEKQTNNQKHNSLIL